MQIQKMKMNINMKNEQKDKIEYVIVDREICLEDLRAVVGINILSSDRLTTLRFQLNNMLMSQNLDSKF